MKAEKKLYHETYKRCVAMFHLYTLLSLSFSSFLLIKYFSADKWRRKTQL